MYPYLPKDLITMICEGLLCHHCQNRGEFPHADTTEVCENKTTLSRVSRVCHGLRDWIQPILYHYYATGNRMDITPGKLTYPYPYQSPDRLHLFLRTLASRPDLAQEVVSMQLVDYHDGLSYDDHTAYRYSAGDILIIRQLIAWSRQYNLLPTDRVREVVAKLDTETLYGPLMQDIHHWLVCLALVLAANARDVLLVFDITGPFLLAFHEGQFRQLSSLRKLAVMGMSGMPYSFSSLRELMNVAPNLECLYALDSDHLSFIPAAGKNAGYSPLMHMKKLVLGSLHPPYLGFLLRCVDGLEELEYYWTAGGSVTFDLALSLKHTWRTLKRLCIACLPAPHGRNWAPIPWYGHAVDNMIQPLESLADFPRLEDITIDYRSLFREDEEDTADRLTRFLPPAIRRLRLSWIVGDMTESLMQLAFSADKYFPELTTVDVGV
ncbi:hypothetical protein PG990_004460 [Apiospora arundinis]